VAVNKTQHKYLSSEISGKL